MCVPVKKDDHIPTWKNVFFNFFFAFFAPIFAFMVFDMSGFTHWVLEQFGAHGKIDPNQFNRMIDMIFHSGMTHIFACASLHFIFNGISGAWCILFHKHN